LDKITTHEIDRFIESIGSFSGIQLLSIFPEFGSQDIAEYFFLNLHKIHRVRNLYLGIEYLNLKKAFQVYNAFKAFHIKAYHLESIGFGLTPQ